MCSAREFDQNVFTFEVKFVFILHRKFVVILIPFNFSYIKLNATGINSLVIMKQCDMISGTVTTHRLA